jgi:hypothetical protein
MTKAFGRGVMQSLQARVDADVHELVRANKTLRHARYGIVRRLLRRWIVDRPVVSILSTYVTLICTLVMVEWAADRFAPSLVHGVPNADFSKDAAGFFLAAQVGILAVLTVAIGVVTLLTQRDDGSSVNTDVRLYYVESFSYELATSGILLSCILIVQLFWPLLPLIALIVGDNSIEHFKIFVTSLHALWLVLNFFLFLHFINTTLRFVEPQSRARLRKQYSANEIIPRDVGRRLRDVYYANTPTQILGAEEVKKGPLISFGMGLISDDQATTEISRSFTEPAQLADVWLLPLGFALRNWQRRTRKLREPQNRFGETLWDGHLAILTDFNRAHDEELELVVREGGVPLTHLERVLIGLSFRFAVVNQRKDSLPTPTDFIEQLISKVVNQIDASLPSGFDDALKEAVDFHSFVLKTQNTRDERGVLINLAQMYDGPFRCPDYEWLREYRRAYSSAIDKMTSDSSFVHGMSGLVVRLWPHDPETYPPSVLQNILDLGRHQVATFEAWVTKRAVGPTPEGAAAPDLAGSDLRVYEDALVQFVSSWETLEQVIISSFEVHQSLQAGDETYWARARASWPSLQTHMRNVAYFLAAAVWNEDLAGSDRFRDLLVRWVQIFYAQLQNSYPFRDALMLTPSLFSASWSDAQVTATRTLIYPESPPRAKSVFGIVLREAYHDALAITGAVLLHWSATKQQPSGATSQTALLILRREILPGTGNTLLDGASNSKSIFRLIFDLLIRETLHSRFDKSSYSGYLEGLIRILNEMATPRMVPGRIYGGFALGGFQRLTPEFLAILGGNLPPDGDAGISELFHRLLNNYPEFQDDRLLRDFIYQFGLYAAPLDGEPDERFRATIMYFVDDMDFTPLRARLKSIFDGVVTVITERRLQRIREAPLDEKRLKTVRNIVENTLLANKPLGGAFSPISIVRIDQPLNIRETTFGEMDRGCFTHPEMSGLTFSDLPPIFAQMAIGFFQNITWFELNQRPKIVEEFRTDLGVPAFLDRVQEVAEAPNLGDELILIVPMALFGHAIHMTISGFPQDGLDAYGLTREAGAESDLGSLYVGTMGKIRIYTWQFDEAAVLCSRTLLKAVKLGRVHDLDAIFDFKLYDSDDPTKSRVRMWLATEFEWEDRSIVEIRFSGKNDGAIVSEDAIKTATIPS